MNILKLCIHQSSFDIIDFENNWLFKVNILKWLKRFRPLTNMIKILRPNKAVWKISLKRIRQFGTTNSLTTLSTNTQTDIFISLFLGKTIIARFDHSSSVVIGYPQWVLIEECEWKCHQRKTNKQTETFPSLGQMSQHFVFGQTGFSLHCPNLIGYDVTWLFFKFRLNGYFRY